jgi:hypothetical protein
VLANDPVLTPYPVFQEKDIKAHPKPMACLSKRLIAQATRLTRGVKVSAERLAEDITF